MTIDWFSPWPAEALLGVGVRILEGLSLVLGPATAASGALPASGSQNGAKTFGNGANSVCGSLLQHGSGAAGPAGAAAASAVDSMVVRVARMCVEVHKGVEAEAERLYQQLQRR
jgi:hypothetical protein